MTTDADTDPVDELFADHKGRVTLVLQAQNGALQAVGLRLLLKGLLRRGGYRCIKTIPGDATIQPARPAEGVK